MKIILSILVFTMSLGINAQTENCILKSGQFNLGINADGRISTINSEPSSELISGSGNHLFKFINLWISSKDTGNHLHITTVNGFNNKNDYSPGPIDSLTSSGAEPEEFNKVWFLTSSNINDHIKNYSKPGYIPIDAIKTWPANGYGRFNKYLAPFADNNQNGKYDYDKGDFPLIEGDNAAFFLINDNYFEHKASGGQPLKIELYCMLYSYNLFPNTIFAKYYIKNPTNTDFHDIILSIHTVFELGNSNDNYCGTSVTSNTIFSYNGDDNDDNHFGKNKPIAMISFLGKELSSSIYITNDSDSLSGMPTTPENHRNMMEGNWKNEKTMSFGGDGKGNNLKSKFVYAGNTDPDYKTSNWIETQTPGLRSMLANTNIGNLLAKKYITLDFAISVIDNTLKNPYEYVSDKYSEIKNHWLAQGMSVKNKDNVEKLLIQKNPISAGENFYQIEYNKFDKISIISSYGMIVKEINPKTQNELKIEESGLFFIKYNYGNQVYIKKVIIINF